MKKQNFPFSKRLICFNRLALSLLIGAIGLAPASLLSAPTPQSTSAQSPTQPVLSARRIVSLVPQATEALFAFGAGNLIVGVSTSSQWPYEAKRKPQVGGVLNPQIEQIVNLNPDLVILSKNHILHNRDLRNRGIPTLTVSTDSVNDALRMMHDLSFIVGKENEARASEERMLKRLNSLAEKYQQGPRRRVLVSIAHDTGAFREVLAVAGGNYIDEVIRTAGGTNVASAKNAMGAVSVRMNADEIRIANPQVVIDLQLKKLSDEERSTLEAHWRGLVGKQAVIHLVHDPYLGVPGMKMPETIERMAGWIHAAAPPTTSATKPAE